MLIRHFEVEIPLDVIPKVFKGYWLIDCMRIYAITRSTRESIIDDDDVRDFGIEETT